MITPNFPRLAEALARHGVASHQPPLAAAEPHVKQQLDVAPTIQATDDTRRGYVYFDLILEADRHRARAAATAAALAELMSFKRPRGHLGRGGARRGGRAGPAAARGAPAGGRVELQRALRRILRGTASSRTWMSSSTRTRRASRSPTRACSRSRSSAPGAIARPRFTAATSTRSTSSAPARPACRRCCSIRRACTRTPTARACRRCRSSRTRLALGRRASTEADARRMKRIRVSIALARRSSPRRRGHRCPRADALRQAVRRAAHSVALKPARVFDAVSQAPHEGWVVLVTGNRIAAAGPAAAWRRPPGAKVD